MRGDRFRMHSIVIPHLLRNWTFSKKPICLQAYTLQWREAGLHKQQSVICENSHYIKHSMKHIYIYIYTLM